MANKIPVLIIGCGNIGALYDFKKQGIKTHVKAFCANEDFKTTVFDQDKELAETIATHYQIEYLPQLDDLSRFRAVVVSSPTPTHFELLKRCLVSRVPVIVCEKPVTDSLANLDALRQLKSQSSSSVIVNYFRRFHPCYEQLREYIKNLGEELTNIQIVYQRGFLNNATHGLDLLNFLFGEVALDQVTVGTYALDEFKNDPTLSLMARFRSASLSIQGLQFVRHSFFEMKLWFETKLVSIEKNGETIRVYSAARQPGFYLPLERVSSRFDDVNAIEDAMRFVVKVVKAHCDDPQLGDNFETSCFLNEQSLKIIDQLCHN